MLVTSRHARATRIVGTAAIVLGAGLLATAVSQDPRPAPLVLKGVIPCAVFVLLGLVVLKRPATLTTVLGAGAGALSAPLYYLALMDAGHPLGGGADIGRGLVGLTVPIFLALNMAVGAAAAIALRRPAMPEAESRQGQWPLARRLATVLGLGTTLLAASILVVAYLQAPPDPRVAQWELLHHGIVPAVPLAALGLAIALLPSRLVPLCGALAGSFPALICSSLLVDPPPDSDGQSVQTLIALSLPLTLPMTVGVGILCADQFRRSIERRALRGRE